MILDVARHKFYEGLITLFVTTMALTIFLIVNSGDSGSAYASYSPVMSLLSAVTYDVVFVQKSIVAILYVISVLTLSRSTLRTHIYPSDTMATMSTCAVVMLPMLATGAAFRESVVVLLGSVALANMFYCFGPHRSMHRLFSAMLAAGLLAMVDPSLAVVPIAMSVALIVARKRVREVVVVVVGMLLPIFTCFYIQWLLGVGFTHSISVWWSSAVKSIDYSILDSMSIARLIFVAYVLFMQVVSSVYYFSQHDVHSQVMRGAWRSLHLISAVVALALVLLPSASDSLLAVALLLSSAMLPMFFVCSGVIISSICYVVLFILAIAASI